MHELHIGIHQGELGYYMFNPNFTALAVSEHAKSYVKHIYLYLDIYTDSDITHVTIDVWKNWSFTGVHFRITDFKSEQKFVYEIQFVWLIFSVYFATHVRCLETW